MARIKINKPNTPPTVKVNKPGESPSIVINRPVEKKGLFSKKFSKKFN